MAGFEIAGVVLGTIPLVISALGHYGNGLATILIRTLDSERVKLQDVCEKMLVGLAPHSKVEDMVNGPLGPLWSDQLMQSKIKTRSWRSAGPFERTVTDMKTAIDEMIQRLDLQPDGKVKLTESSSIIREFKRATFTINRSSYEDLMSTIKDGTTALEGLVDRSIDLEPGRQGRSQGRQMKLLRGLFHSVYYAIFWSLICNCTHILHLSLPMLKQSIDIAHDDDDDERIT
ncbi:hypothetical protein B0T24DRAFT_599678 [Lasiosphaeria ovina]|uniref:Uncharacterized protein n=1 Tax=Lasiosphaeria ovina TaxID=92902 RepID=A0AAE0JTS1_9PEZI|nr:hypothetical protein B0T24DRAFT_599678 [Lasiosphaeria ovina]